MSNLKETKCSFCMIFKSFTYGSKFLNLIIVILISVKKRSRSRGMSTISQFVKLRPLKQFSSMVTEQLEPLNIQMRSASLLLLIMFLAWVISCLATMSWWGKQTVFFIKNLTLKYISSDIEYNTLNKTETLIC